jgi:hypothetical protein
MYTFYNTEEEFVHLFTSDSEICIYANITTFDDVWFFFPPPPPEWSVGRWL